MSSRASARGPGYAATLPATSDATKMSRWVSAPGTPDSYVAFPVYGTTKSASEADPGRLTVAPPTVKSA